MASINRTKVTVALETTPGVFATPQYVLPIRGVTDLDATATKTEDPVITGRNMTSGFYLTAKTSGGSVPMSPRAVPALALALSSALGADLVPIQIGAVARMRYKGASASAKIVANTSADTLTSAIGVLGAEAADTDFGTAGSISLAATATDTVGELVAEINGYTNYDCELVTGDPATAAGNIVSIDASQAKDHWVYLFFTSTTSGMYWYELPVDLGEDERPTLTVQVDGRQESEAYTGVQVGAITLSAALQAMAESDATTLALAEIARQRLSASTTSASAAVTGVDTRHLVAGMTVTGAGIEAGTTIQAIVATGESGSLTLSANATATGTTTLTFALPLRTALTLEDAKPLLFHKGSTSLGGKDYTYVSNVSFEMTNNAKENGFGQGSVERLYHQKGMFQAMGTMQLRLDADTYEHRDQVFDGRRAAVNLLFRGGKVGLVDELVIADLPHCELKTFTRPDNEGVYDASIEYEAVAPPGAVYDHPVTVHLIMATEIT